MPTDRELIQKWWLEAWTDGLWSASWQKSLEGLTPQQAAWQPSTPAGPRHSIWQIVLHMIFWRESWFRRASTGQKPTKEEVAAGNFPAVPAVTDEAWNQARHHFHETQDRMIAALKISDPSHEVLIYFLPHDMYHFGQINYLRAMQGLPPIE